MRLAHALSRLLGRRRTPRRSIGRRRKRVAIEQLDRRELMATLALVSATTVDSRSVTVDYTVGSTSGTTPTLGVYRSATAQFDAAAATAVDTALVLPATDSAGQSATAVGPHRVTVTVPEGLAINPRQPYVLVVANPSAPGVAVGDPGTVAAFRKATLGIVTHGGIQNQAWRKNGPPWALKMARSLLEQGYDRVIPFNWVSESNKPGHAVRQAPRLARLVRQMAAKFPDGEPVDIHWIGHSEGTVINTQAIVRVERSASPEIRAGYVEDTLLDPHAANPEAPGRQYSTGGILGLYAQLTIDKYETSARDPLVFVPRSVDSARVFYQQTPASRDHGTNRGIYNLWGQVPLRGEATYFNLTQAGVVHSGHQGVQAWYQKHVVPTLGEGSPELAAMTIEPDGAGAAIQGREATYSGTAEPNAAVRLSVAHGPGRLRLAARTTAGPDGTWTATTRPLAPGTYRVIAESKAAGATKADHVAIPTVPLGKLVIPR